MKSGDLRDALGGSTMGEEKNNLVRGKWKDNTWRGFPNIQLLRTFLNFHILIFIMSFVMKRLSEQFWVCH